MEYLIDESINKYINVWLNKKSDITIPTIEGFVFQIIIKSFYRL